MATSDLALKSALPEEKIRRELPHAARQRLLLQLGCGGTCWYLNHDGVNDITTSPSYFHGPNPESREIYAAQSVNPSTEYPNDCMQNFAFDFTGDGWPDILASEMQGGRPMDLYVNPKGDARRWDKFRVLPTINTEIVLMKDLDKDGKPEIHLRRRRRIFLGPPRSRESHRGVDVASRISAPGGTVTVHGLGVGDVNSDGQLRRRDAERLVPSSRLLVRRPGPVDLSPRAVLRRGAASSRTPGGGDGGD